ncbi:PadR family transcriptional regulator [Microbacterium sp. ZW T5_56]|uniref:PadR family transcriptional regulator n=1 Tax=Microbacterium sp. ZW T5_56 TaxID=3378081 RepID=UPI003851B377
MTLTSAELTILGLVIEQPRHGYDLERIIDQRGIRQWTDIGFSSIYYVLAKLEKRGLVGSDAAAAGPTSRRVMHATATGREEARVAAAELLEHARPTGNPFLVALANLDLVGASYSDALRARLNEVDARLAAIRAAEQSQQPLPRAAREVFAYSLNQWEAERAWLIERTGEK